MRLLARSSALLAIAFVSINAVAQVEPLEEHEISRDGRVIRYVKFQNQLYRAIEPEALAGLALEDAPLHQLLVSIEGKFDSFIPPNRFRLIGSDRDFVVRDGQMVISILKGDNIWIGGQAMRLPSEPSCYVNARHIVKLPEDGDLFQIRYDKIAADGDWRRMLDLGRWIETSGKKSAIARMEDTHRYRRMREQAVRQALRMREREIAVGDSESWYELARMYLDLLGRAGRLPASEHLRKSVAGDADNARAVELLQDLGYERFEGRWITQGEREDIERRRAMEATNRTVETVVGPEKPDKPAEVKPARAAYTHVETMRKAVEIEHSMRNSETGLAKAIAGISDLPELVARRVVWALANRGDADGLAGLQKALESSSLKVRMDVAEALAWGDHVEDLAEIARTDGDVEVRAHVVDTLMALRTRRAVEALVSLVDVRDERTKQRVDGALERMTGKSVSEPAGWVRWWEENRNSFRLLN